LIKSYLKSKNILVRLAIGIGEKNFESTKISERNGSAYYFSGTLLETIKKEKITLAVKSENKKNDETFNLMLQLTNSLTDSWLTSSAEIVYLQFLNQEKSQEELGTLLNISQAAISKRTKRSHFELVKKVDLYYRENFIPN
jgi:DNA-directed RNA polymerase specialized sigma subunit